MYRNSEQSDDLTLFCVFLIITDDGKRMELEIILNRNCSAVEGQARRLNVAPKPNDRKPIAGQDRDWARFFE
jgi:hypothetical protein